MKKLKEISSFLMVLGLIILIKMPIVGLTLFGLGMTFWPFYMLLSQKDY